MNPQDNDPLHALSDGMQSLYPEQFARLMEELRRMKGNNFSD